VDFELTKGVCNWKQVTCWRLNKSLEGHLLKQTQKNPEKHFFGHTQGFWLLF
jgi:hypothetical protein